MADPITTNKKEISFFTKPYWISRIVFETGQELIIPSSSFIRGEQIAKYLNAKYNPKDGYENDICIYIKPENLDDIKDGSYVDIIDGAFLIKQLKNRPGINIIVCSESSYNHLENILKNKLFLIPQHHCNFERLKGQKKEPIVVGTIGLPLPQIIENEIMERLADIGLKFINYSTYQSRQDIVDFYKTIDIQIAWAVENNPLKNPMKIINAASFGIPTIAHRQIGYKEFEDNYIPVETLDELIKEVKKLKDEKNLYNYWSTKIIGPAEKYHISKIAKMYGEL
jgi:hypothetical protein